MLPGHDPWGPPFIEGTIGLMLCGPDVMDRFISRKPGGRTLSSLLSVFRNFRREAVFCTVGLILGGWGIYYDVGGLRTALHLDTKIHSLSSIQDGQIIQRAFTDPLTPLHLSGRVGFLASEVEVAASTASVSNAISDAEWLPLDKALRGTVFDGQIALPAGWHWLHLRSIGDGGRLANPVHVGIGEVFVVAGQSNAAGSSTTLFAPAISWVRNAQMGRDGKPLWKSGADPQVPGGGGSVWPIVGDLLAEYMKGPVGFINTSVGASSVRDWQPGSEAFESLVRAIKEAGPSGPRAVLWHQGESDGDLDQESYYRLLRRVIEETHQRIGRSVPWLVANASYVQGETAPQVRRAQQRLWQEGWALPGPDTDLLTAPLREWPDGVHFNERGTRRAALAWFQNIISQLPIDSAEIERAELRPIGTVR